MTRFYGSPVGQGVFVRMDLFLTDAMWLIMERIGHDDESAYAAGATPSPSTDDRPVSALKLGAVLLSDDFDDPSSGSVTAPIG